MAKVELSIHRKARHPMVWDQLLPGALTLAGVWLGAILGSRGQRALMKQAQGEARITALSAVFADYLSAYRTFRRYVLTEAPTVQLVSRGEPGRITEVIEGSRHYWDLVDHAMANLSIHCRDSTVLDKAKGVRDEFWKIANARASHGIGDVPDQIVKAAKDAEDAFATAANAHLDQLARS